ncbi:MAG: hypothetical protein GX595_17765 [Lentisphaerae bacterium]|nr:hypothetical protein [Lentisphaerota bacterium]
MQRVLWSSVTLICGMALAQADGLITSFETDTDNPFRAGGGAVMERVERHASEGRFSLQVTLKGSAADSWPGITLPADNQGDWSHRDVLAMDIYLEGDTPRQLSTRFDAAGRPGIFGGGNLKPGWNRNWSVNLKALRAEADLAHAKSLLLYARMPREDMVLCIDNLRWTSFAARFKRLEYLETADGVAPSDAERDRGFVAWGHSPLQVVFPSSRPQGRLEALRDVVAQGELESLTFSLHALRDLGDVRIVLADLRGPGGAVLPAATAEVRTMRYLDKRVTYSSDQYYHAMPSYLATLTAPVAIPAGRTQTFDLLFRGPADLPPGRYAGAVTVQAGSQSQAIPVEVLLLPWRLPEAEGLLYGEYYRTRGQPAEWRERLRADLADMRRQGMTSVGLCFGPDPTSYRRDGERFTIDFQGDTLFEAFMETYVELGFPGPVILLADSGQSAAFPVGSIDSEAFARAYTNFHQALAAAVQAKGWPELIIQPVDEPGWQDQEHRDRNVTLLKLLKAAGRRTEQDGPGDGYFHNEAGPWSDVWNYNGALSSAAITTKALAEGRLITLYNNDVESYRPEVDRWAYGLFNWRWRLHGGYNWEYRGGRGDLYDNLDDTTGDWVHRYLPQGSEPGGPSTGWEASREGVDDRRYLILAERLIDEATAAGGAAAVLAGEARADLDDLRQRLDGHPGIRGRSQFTEAISLDQARKRGLLRGETAASAFVGGLYKHPNGLAFEEYDAIRWMVARHSWRLLAALGRAPVLAEPTAPAPARDGAERLRVRERHNEAAGKDQPRPAVRLPALANAPTLDGDLDEAAWQQAASLTLTLNDGSGPASADTTARVGLHGDHLYIAFLCNEPDTERMVATVKETDGQVWRDDCIEVFIDPGLSGKGFYQVLVNSLGTIARVGPGGAAWQPAVRAAARVEPAQQRWVVELAIPTAGLTLGPRFGLNLARERRPMEVLELSAWSPTGGSFGQPERFGVAVLSGDLPQAAAAPASLEMQITPGYALTTTDAVEASFRVGLTPERQAKARLSVTIEGPAGTLQSSIAAPLADRVGATLATGDLPPGTYRVTAQLWDGDAVAASAETRFTRIPAPW